MKLDYLDSKIKENTKKKKKKKTKKHYRLMSLRNLDANILSFSRKQVFITLWMDLVPPEIISRI